jgi:tricorn protease-like protein
MISWISWLFFGLIHLVALATPLQFNSLDSTCQTNLKNTPPLLLQWASGPQQIQVKQDCEQVTLEVSFADGRVISRQIELLDLHPSLSYQDHEIELAQLFSPTRDTFETEQEFQQRRQYLLKNRPQLLKIFNQGVQQHNPRYQAGTAFLDKPNYNADSGNFSMRIEWQEWAKVLNLPEKVNIKLDSYDARTLWKDNSHQPVYVLIEPVGNQLKISKQMLVGLGKEWLINNPLPTTLQTTLHGHRKRVYSVAFSADGRLLASASGDNMIKLWWLPSGELLGSLQGHKNAVYSVAFSPDSKFIVSGSKDKTVKLWEINTGRVWRTWRHKARVWTVAFHPNGEIIASGSHDNTIKLWEVQTGKLLNTFNEHNSSVLSVTFSPDGKLIGSGDQDGIINIWDAETHKVVHVILEHSHVASVAFSPDGRLLASGSKNNSIKIWDVKTGNELAVLQGHGNAVQSVAFSADGYILASGSDDSTIKLWDVQSSQPLDLLSQHGNSVLSVAFSPDGRFFASASKDKTIKLWRP